MKHILYFQLLIIIFTISCTPINEEPEIESDFELLAKVWQNIESVRFYGSEHPLDNYIGYIFVFNEDGTFNFSRRASQGLNVPETGSWEIRNDNIILNLGLDDQRIIQFENLTPRSVTFKFLIKNTFKGDIDIDFDFVIP